MSGAHDGVEPRGYAWDTLPVTVPDNAFYAAIDEEMRQLIYLLRNNGINTSCSCSHESPPCIQFEVWDQGEVETIHQLLCCNGFCDYEITTRFAFPKDGPGKHFGEVMFHEWPLRFQVKNRPQ